MRRKWTEEEIEVIKEYYPTYPTRKIAEKLGRSIKSIEGRAKYMGIRKEEPNIGYYMTPREKREWFALRCPKDCPFIGQICGKMPFCNYAAYAEYINPTRPTRMTIGENGKEDFHIPPNCDLYEKFKGKKIPHPKQQLDI